jgi:hypothetical protein
MTDITNLLEQEAQRREMEQAQRDALVQEVHHRIKNNLQGIMGMLRTLDHQHPDLHAPITQVIGQIHSISVIHGLQGRASADRVRLCELTSAVAAGIESLWHTPIHVDIPTPWQACRISPTEAVPAGAGAQRADAQRGQAWRAGTPGCPGHAAQRRATRPCPHHHRQPRAMACTAAYPATGRARPGVGAHAPRAAPP